MLFTKGCMGIFEENYTGGGNSLIVNYLRIHKSALSKIGQNCGDFVAV